LRTSYCDDRSCARGRASQAGLSGRQALEGLPSEASLNGLDGGPELS
jgi:hypothetical protein